MNFLKLTCVLICTVGLLSQAFAQTPDQRWPGQANLISKSNKIEQETVFLPFDYIQSPNKQWYLAFQGDGNMVVYGVNGKVNYQSASYGKGGNVLRFQGDGNFVVYKKTINPIWEAGIRSGAGKYNLTLDDNGKISITNASGAVVWSKP